MLKWPASVWTTWIGSFLTKFVIADLRRTWIVVRHRWNEGCHSERSEESPLWRPDVSPSAQHDNPSKYVWRTNSAFRHTCETSDCSKLFCRIIYWLRPSGWRKPSEQMVQLGTFITGHVMVEHSPNHFLIRETPFSRNFFEKVHAFLAQGDCYLDVFLLQGKFLRRWKKIVNHLECDGFITISYSLFHKPTFPFSSIRHQ